MPVLERVLLLPHFHYTLSFPRHGRWISAFQPSHHIRVDPERLVLLHGEVDLAFTVLPHDEGNRRDNDTIDQIETSFERG